MDLAVFNTEVVAKMIQKITGADLFHIDPVNSYPDDYNEPLRWRCKNQSYELSKLG